MNQQRKPDVPGKNCVACGSALVRKVYKGTLESYGRYLAREHCSQSCANTRVGPVTRDAYHWRARRHRKSCCEVCDVATGLHVHHKDRDRTNNDPSNLQTLCDSCHLKLHWREDRVQRMASKPKKARTCVVCAATHYVKGVQTCGPACKRRLLSQRAYERYSKAAAS